jgi:rfaE bifunctional protein kinase chain/domain
MENDDNRGEELCSSLTRYNELRIAVVGDIILDWYIYGLIKKPTGETPRNFAAIVKKEEEVLGGAANVANNLVKAGIGKTWLIGLGGEDETTKRISDLCEKNGIEQRLVTDENYKLPKKLRSFTRDNGGLYVPDDIRWDFELDSGELMEKFRDRGDEILNTLEIVLSLDEPPNAIIVSDYTKGTLSREVLDGIRELAAAKGITIIADPKYFSRERDKGYKGYDWINPNGKNARKMLGIPTESRLSHESLTKKLSRKYKANVMVTFGEEGMIICERGNIMKIKAKEATVRDITGAGDTVKAYFAASLLTGLSPEDAGYIASMAAYVAIQKKMTYAVEKEAVLRALVDRDGSD